MTAPVVRFVNADTGEIKERHTAGTERGVTAAGEAYADDWEATSLDLALALVPDLLAAIDAARAHGESLQVSVIACLDPPATPSAAWRLARLEGLAQGLCDEIECDGDTSAEVRACITSVRQALTKGDRP